jgi:hypothetical protein
MGNFTGLLYYDESDNEHLVFSDFIVRDDAISFTFDSISANYGRWSATGIATNLGGGLFRAEKIVASQQGTNADPWGIEFQVEPIGETLYVEGVIMEAGSVHPFSGDLDPKSNLR